MIGQVRAEERADLSRMVRSPDGEPTSAIAATTICTLAAGFRAELVAPEPAIDAATATALLCAAIAVARRGVPTDLLTG